MPGRIAPMKIEPWRVMGTFAFVLTAAAIFWLSRGAVLKFGEILGQSLAIGILAVGIGLPYWERLPVGKAAVLVAVGWFAVCRGVQEAWSLLDCSPFGVFFVWVVVPGLAVFVAYRFITGNL